MYLPYSDTNVIAPFLLTSLSLFSNNLEYSASFTSSSFPFESLIDGNLISAFVNTLYAFSHPLNVSENFDNTSSISLLNICFLFSKISFILLEYLCKLLSSFIYFSNVAVSISVSSGTIKAVFSSILLSNSSASLNSSTAS